MSDRDEFDRLNREYARHVVATLGPLTAEERAQIVAILRDAPVGARHV